MIVNLLGPSVRSVRSSRLEKVRQIMARIRLGQMEQTRLGHHLVVGTTLHIRRLISASVMETVRPGLLLGKRRVDLVRKLNLDGILPENGRAGFAYVLALLS